jgi:hypothetical protein
MYLDTIYISTEFRPDRTSNILENQQSAIIPEEMAGSSQVAILENQQSAITPEVMAGSSPNFYHRYI